MSSIEPDDGGCKIDCAEEISGGFVVACGDGTILFEFGKEIFYQVAGFIEFFVVFPLFNAIGFWRDNTLNTRLLQKVKNALFRIKGFIREQGLYFFKNSRQENIGALQIMRLSRREMKARGIAQSITGGVDFGGQSALAAPDGFLLADVFGLLTPFLRAPAAC